MTFTFYTLKIKDKKPILFIYEIKEKDALNKLQEKVNNKPDKYLGKQFILIDVTLTATDRKNLVYGPIKLSSALYEVNKKLKLKVPVNDSRLSDVWYPDELVSKFTLAQIQKLATRVWENPYHYELGMKLLITDLIHI